jgi:hypothetical protein
VTCLDDTQGGNGAGEHLFSGSIECATQVTGKLGIDLAEERAFCGCGAR